MQTENIKIKQQKQKKCACTKDKCFRGGTALIADKIYVISYWKKQKVYKNKGDYIYA